MIRLYELGIGLLVALILFGAGYYSGRGQVATDSKQIDTSTDQKIVYRDRIVTVTKTVKPDGTVTTTTKTEDDQKQTDTQTKTAETDKSSTPVLSNYSLGVQYRISYAQALRDSTTFDYSNIEVTAGRRLMGDVWANVGVSKQDISLGLSVQF